jgi:cobalamin biosynthesis Co2+ chelatase CbiK
MKAVAAAVLLSAGLAIVAITQLATLPSILALAGFGAIVVGAVAGFLDLDDVRRESAAL